MNNDIYLFIHGQFRSIFHDASRRSSFDTLFINTAFPFFFCGIEWSNETKI